MLPCFGSWNHKGEIDTLQGLPEYGKSRKGASHVRTFFLQVVFTVVK